MEPELDSPPFSTVPATPSIEDVDVAWTRSIALSAPDWRLLANQCGIHPADMTRFLKGECMLTAPNRAFIRGALAKVAGDRE